MKKVFIFSLFALSFFNLNAQVLEEIKPEASVIFKIKNFGVNVDGHFETISIATLFNSENELTDISATIEVESITTGMESRDKHILKEDFFFVEKHKTIRLETIQLKKESLENYLLTANLIIKNVSKQIAIPIQVKKTKDAYVISSNFEINRKNFNVGGSGLVLGKTVKIDVRHTHQL